MGTLYKNSYHTVIIAPATSNTVAKCSFGISDTLNKIRGMFAFALFDAVNDNIILARDAFGEKPLYYLVQNNTFAVGYFTYCRVPYYLNISILVLVFCWYHTQLLIDPLASHHR